MTARPGERQRPWAAACVAIALLLSACTGDSSDVPNGLDGSIDDGADIVTGGGHEQAQADPGGLDIPVVDGSYAVPLPSLGFGLALPDQWQATVLTDAALERVSDANLVAPFFLQAARTVAQTAGAVFYAAGIDERERVTDLKIIEVSDVATDLASIRNLAESIVEGGAVREGAVTDAEGPAGSHIRLDFRLEQTDAETDDTIDAYVTQLFVPAGDIVWSIIITGEDAANRNLLVSLVADTFVLADES